MSHQVSPSILAADFLHLEDQIELVNKSQADYLHIDIMDGNFVPNISFGQSLMPFFKQVSEVPLDVHLMIANPERYIADFAKGGAHILTVHYEASTHLHRIIQQIRDLGCRPGVAINPHTSVDALEDILEEIDVVCVMSVNPGFYGQKFIYQSIPKIRRLKNRLIERNLQAAIEVDGGVGLHNAESILKAGADILVAGSCVFKSNDPTKTISQLKGIGARFMV